MVSAAAAAPSLCCWDGEGREDPRWGQRPWEGDDSIIRWLLQVRGSKSGKNVQLQGQEIGGLWLLQS